MGLVVRPDRSAAGLAFGIGIRRPVHVPIWAEYILHDDLAVPIPHWAEQWKRCVSLVSAITCPLTARPGILLWMS